MPKSRPWRRLIATVGAILAVSTLSLVSPTTSPASADTGCPTAAAPSGSGTLFDAYLISTPAHLQYLRDNPAQKYYRVTANIDMGGCVWSSGIDSFRGSLDGLGHVVSNLSVTATSGADVGFINSLAYTGSGVPSSGIVQNLGFTGNVSLTRSSGNNLSVSVGGLVGRADGGSLISNVYTTGNVSVSLAATESSGVAQATAQVGGIVGYSNSSVQDVYSTGNVSGTVGITIVAPYSGSYSSLAQVGGIAGFQSAGTVTRAFATGAISGSATGFLGASTRLGALVGRMSGTLSNSVWNTQTSGRPGSTGMGSADISVVGKTTAQMKTLATYSDSPVSWTSIASGYDGSKMWGICPSVNSDYPFLTAFYNSSPCPPVPTLSGPGSSSGPSAGGTSVVLAGSNLLTATAVTFGGTNATSFNVDSNTQITATSSAGTPGTTVDIAVTAPGGTATLANGFTYDRLPQTVTWTPTTALTTTESPLTPSASASALGSPVITYAVVGTPTTTTCSVDGVTGVLTFTGQGSCTVRASAAATSTYDAGSADVTFTSSLASQSIVAVASRSALTIGQTATLSTTGALGTGAVTWTVASGPSKCAVSGATLTALAAGTCVVRASIAADDVYAADTDDITITVIASDSGGGSGGSGSSGGGSSGASSGSSVEVLSSLGSTATPVVSTSGLPPIVPQAPTTVPQPTEGTALIAGQSIGISVTQSGNVMTVSVTGTPIEYSLGSIDRNRVANSRSRAFPTGVPTEFRAHGFSPGSPVTVYAMSTPVLVASTVANADGVVDGLITLPTSLGTGQHTMVVSGYLSDGTPMVSYVGITTRASMTTVKRYVFFSVGSWELSSPMKLRLARLASSMRGHVPTTVTVGVVRSGNPTRAEQVLAVRRARAVADYLKSRGMPGVVRIGASIPSSSNSWVARRADVTVTL